MAQGMRYRLALDLGSTSLGWAMIRLNADNQPCAVIKAGVRIFSDGRNPKDGSSLAVMSSDRNFTPPSITSGKSLVDWDMSSDRNGCARDWRSAPFPCTPAPQRVVTQAGEQKPLTAQPNLLLF